MKHIDFADMKITFCSQQPCEMKEFTAINFPERKLTLQHSAKASELS